MKLNDYTHHNADPRSRITARWRSVYVLMLALAGITLLAASCTKDDAGNIPGDNTQPTPVRLIAGIQHTATPATTTRTAPGGTDGTQAVWDESDHIGLFMLPTGGKIPDDTLLGAHNVPYKVVNPATGELTQVAPLVYDPVTDSWNPGVLTPMYYPSTDEAVDFVAYYPYYRRLAEDSPLRPSYIYVAGIFDQTTAENQLRSDFLYSDNAHNIHRSKNAVTLQFRHLMAKLRLDITLGEGFERGEVTKVTLPGMPWEVKFDMRDGSVNKIEPPSNIDIISCLPLPSPAAGTGATASFTAIVPPHEGAKFKGRKITVTVDGEDYTGTIPDTDNYAADTLYAYPVRVTPRGLTIGAPNTDVPWTDAKPLPQGYDLTVGNETELRRFAELVNTGGKLPNGTFAAEAKVLQTADIVLTQDWTPIGIGADPFFGTYNGDGHTITGLTITTVTPSGAGSSAYAGLFGAVGNQPTDTEQGAVLTGIHLRKVQIDIPAGGGETKLYVASIAGFIYNSTLSLCSAEGTVKASSSAEKVHAGGIVGYNIFSTISRCRASVETKAASTATEGFAYAGGITGENFATAFILSCEAQGSSVTAQGSEYAIAGGITGFNSGSCLIAFCRTGANAVTALNGTVYNSAGGLVGRNIGLLYSCYSRATATARDGSNQAGAIVGGGEPNRVQYCYGTGATGPGNSGLAADPGLGIYYETSPGSDAIYGVMRGYTSIVESIIAGVNTAYPYATRYDRAVYPAHSIEPVRVKWGPGTEVWQRGTNTTYPEINMKYEGEDNPAAP